MLAQRVRRFPAARQQRLPAGSVLFQLSDLSQEIITVDSGLLKVAWRISGTRQPFIFLAKPGLILARTATSWDATTPISASAITDCCVYRVPIAAFIDIVLRDEELLWRTAVQQQETIGELIILLSERKLLSAVQGRLIALRHDVIKKSPQRHETGYENVQAAGHGFAGSK